MANGKDSFPSRSIPIPLALDTPGFKGAIHRHEPSWTAGPVYAQPQTAPRRTVTTRMYPMDDEFQVVRGSTHRCCGCGKFMGIHSIVLTGEESGHPEWFEWPEFPHVEENCPVCQAWRDFDPPVPEAERPVGMRGPIRDRKRAE
jgi:hypothetical protein